MAADTSDIAKLLRALGHEVRLNILHQLLGGEATVGQIEAVGNFRQPLLSQQLAVLRNADLVTTRRDAKLVYYQISPSRFALIRDYISQFAPADQTMAKLNQPQPISAAVFAKIG